MTPEFINSIYMQGDGRTVMGSTGHTILRLDRLRRRNSYDIATLTHECLHAVQFIMEKVGDSLGDNNRDQYCYALEYLVKAILEESRK